MKDSQKRGHVSLADMSSVLCQRFIEQNSA